MNFTTAGKLHALTIVIASMFISYDNPIMTGYVVWSLLLWAFGYPIYFLFGEPGRNDY